MKQISRSMLQRLLALDRAIRDGNYPNASSIARDLEVDPRTIHRDIAFLRGSWGAPLEFCQAKNGYRYTEPDFALPTLRVSEGELAALFLAERLMQQYRSTPYASALATVFKKLATAMPEQVTLNLDHLRDAYSIRPTPIAETNLKVFSRPDKGIRARPGYRYVASGNGSLQRLAR